MKIKWNSEQIPKMNVKNNKDVTFLTYPAYEEMNWLVHGFSTRFGGVSRGIYSSMNLSFTRGDEESCVKENYRRISDAMGFDMNSIVTSDQTHTNNVRKVTEKDRGKGIVIPRDYTDTDGMITNVPGLVLATFYADCVPLYFADPANHAIGLSHSGWRGTVQKIGAVTIEKMSEEYGSNPKDLKVAIGPSICQECYEVSEDVIEEFDRFLAEHGYVREGAHYCVEKESDETVTFFCHFGISCVLLSHLWNVSPFVLWHCLALAPTSVTEVVTEEREQGTAYFRGLKVGDISHLYAGGEEPSFAARFCETYSNKEQRH